MKRIIIEKLIIISQAENKAKIIEFDPKLTVIKSQDSDGNSLNRTGKSLVMKSIFHSFGANLRQYTVNWDKMNICTIVYFSFKKVKFKLYRNGNKSIIIDEAGIWTKFDSIIKLIDYYNSFFDFNIKLVKNKEPKATNLYPGAIFMPFYIDQDRGWNGQWDSFKDVFQGSWKKEILLFHLGVKPNRYYQLLDEQAELSNENFDNKAKHKLLSNFYKVQIERNSNVLDININIDEFKEEIISLTEELNKQLEVKNKLKAEIIDIFNRITELNEIYDNARKNLSELVEDIEYINESIESEDIVCPTCGTVHDNSISNRFMMFKEIEECNLVIDNYFIEKEILGKKIDENEKQIGSLLEYIDKIRSILNKKRKNVSFEEVIKFEGTKTVLLDLNLDLKNLKNEIDNNEGRLRAITNEKTQITKKGKGVLNDYISKLKDNLLFLDVNDLDRSKLNTFTTTLVCGGNDTPTAILAQVFALNYIALKHSKSVVSPIVLDAIFQQEPAKDKIDLIWEFILKKQPEGSQIIISTTEILDTVPVGKVITLLDDRALLSEDDYVKIKKEVHMFKSILLS